MYDSTLETHDCTFQIRFLLHTVSSPSVYSWDSEDSKKVENVDFILAADGNYL